jgi:putative PIN family toxin of toxin-antitoxin system
MRVVLDTNILLSALISHGSPPARIYQAWRDGIFELVTADIQLRELRRASRYPKLRSVLRPHLVGRMINLLHRAVVVSDIPEIHEASDPNDSWLLSLADTEKVDFLVTGDKKAGLLGLRTVGRARIVTAKVFCNLID